MQDNHPNTKDGLGARRDRLGVIAGAGRFPFMVAEGARRAGRKVIVIGLRGYTDPGIVQLADLFRWSGAARLGSWIRFLNRCGVSRVILAGSVRKGDMYGRFRLLRHLPDWTSLRLWFGTLPDKRNDTVLRGVADELARRGITMENCVQYCADDLAPEGVLTRARPNAAQMRDIEFGWSIAKEMGRLDIGQSVAVKETEVIAVEAIEGTDALIKRAGELCRSGGWTLIKVAKPDQDMRFDVPTVGPATIELLHQHGARVLVIEADKTLMVERERVLDAARRHGVVIIGHRPPSS